MTDQSKIELFASFGIALETNRNGHLASTEVIKLNFKNPSIEQFVTRRVISARAVELFVSLTSLADNQLIDIPHYSDGALSLRSLAGLPTKDLTDIDLIDDPRLREKKRSGLRAATSILLRELQAAGLINVAQLPRTEFPVAGSRARSATVITVAADGVLLEKRDSATSSKSQDLNDPFLYAPNHV